MKSMKRALVAVAAFMLLASGLCVQASAGTPVTSACGSFGNGQGCGTDVPDGQ